jgi:tRNA threonylcarbamoyladenosine biosynthesis protein TsaE
MPVFDIESTEAMRGVGAAIGHALEAGDVIALIGDLGAGKTELVKGIARGLGADENEVTSPTFTLIQSYRDGRLPLHHVDLYRLDEIEELRHVGLDDLYRDEAAVAVEWFDRFPTAAPKDYLEVRIAIVDETRRTVSLSAHGPAAERLLSTLAKLPAEL